MRSEVRNYIASHAGSYGGPLLVYDMDMIQRRIDALKRLEARYGCSFFHAVKSFAHLPALRFFARSVAGFDISNIGEWDMVMEAAGAGENASAHEIAITGPDISSLIHRITGRAAASASGPGRESSPRDIMVNLESLHQFELIPADLPRNIRIGARIGMVPLPDRMNSNGKLFTRFGFDPDDTGPISRIAAHPNFSGIHCHTGHKISDIEHYLEIARVLMRLAEDLRLPVGYIDLGGGFQRLSHDDIDAMMMELRRIIPGHIRILFELGEYWTEHAGFAVGRIVSVSTRRNGDIAMVTTDLSGDCHLKWSEPQLRFRIQERGSPQNVLIFGSTCHEEDIIGAYRIPRREDGTCALSRGDLLALEDINGYSASWNTSFNGIQKARVLLYGDTGRIYAQEEPGDAISEYAASPASEIP